jgi:hypothetical protein
MTSTPTLRPHPDCRPNGICNNVDTALREGERGSAPDARALGVDLEATFGRGGTRAVGRTGCHHEVVGSNPGVRHQQGTVAGTRLVEARQGGHGAM